MNQKFDPRDWTDWGYIKRYGYPNTAIEKMRNDCLTGIDSESGKPLSEIEPKLRRFVCAQYMFWIHYLIKTSLSSLKKTAAYGPLDTLAHGDYEIARRVESVLSELEKKVVEKADEKGRISYALEGMSEIEQKLYLERLTKEIFTEFMKSLRDKLGDFYYVVEDYFMDRCKKFGIEPLPDKLPRDKGVEIPKEEEKERKLKELDKKREELIKELEKIKKKEELLKKEIEDIKKMIESEMERILKG